MSYCWVRVVQGWGCEQGAGCPGRGAWVRVDLLPLVLPPPASNFISNLHESQDPMFCLSESRISNDSQKTLMPEEEKIGSGHLKGIYARFPLAGIDSIFKFSLTWSPFTYSMHWMLIILILLIHVTTRQQ